MSAFSTVGDILTDLEFAVNGNAHLWGIGGLTSPTKTALASSSCRGCRTRGESTSAERVVGKNERKRLCKRLALQFTLNVPFTRPQSSSTSIETPTIPQQVPGRENSLLPRTNQRPIGSTPLRPA